MTKNFEEYWRGKTESRHREKSPSFFISKAKEHYEIMSSEDRLGPCVDLGCGAGELLAEFSKLTPVSWAQEPSSSMMASAKIRLGEAVSFSSENVFELLPKLKCRTWLTCQALNQYLSQKEMSAFIELFKGHSTAECLYMYDCIDPVFYHFRDFGSSFRAVEKLEPSRSIFRIIRAFLRRVFKSIQFSLFPKDFEVMELPGIGMGYAYSPIFWRIMGQVHGLEVKFFGSRFYEYRYHVVFTK